MVTLEGKSGDLESHYDTLSGKHEYWTILVCTKVIYKHRNTHGNDKNKSSSLKALAVFPGGTMLFSSLVL